MHGESEWIYLGTEGELDEYRAANLLDTFFPESELYLIVDRHNSLLVQKNEAIISVMGFMKEYNPALTNLDFSKVMEFNKTGIVRIGNRE